MHIYLTTRGVTRVEADGIPTPHHHQHHSQARTLGMIRAEADARVQEAEERAAASDAAAVSQKEQTRPFWVTRGTSLAQKAG